MLLPTFSAPSLSTLENRKTKELLQTWEALYTGTVFSLMEGKDIYLEPYVIDADTGDIDAVVRLFLYEKHAWSYKELMEALNFGENFGVEMVSLDQVYSQWTRITKKAEELNLNLRIEASKLEDDAWPQCIDTLYDAYSYWH